MRRLKCPVNWNLVCCPTNKGGLGIKAAKETNLVAVAKLQWRILQNDDQFWATIFRSKYYVNNLSDFATKRGSPMFKAICKGHEVLKQGIKWIPQKGNRISFLAHAWALNKSIMSIFYGPWFPNDHLLTVEQVWDGSTWNIDDIPYVLTEEIMNSIHAIPFSNFTDSVGEDFFIWKNSPSGKFSSATTYNSIKHGSDFPGDISWVWECPTFLKIRFFLWMLYLNRTTTNHKLHQRGIDCTIICPRCNLDVETTLHTFRDCLRQEGLGLF